MDIKRLTGRLDSLKQERGHFEKFLSGLDRKYAGGAISSQEKEFLLHSATGGLSRTGYLKRISREIIDIERQIYEYRHSFYLRHRPLIVSSIILVLVFTGLIFFIQDSGLTGLITFSDTEQSTLQIDKDYGPGTISYHKIIPQGDGNITSLRINGEYSGDIRIYLVRPDHDPYDTRYLVYESSKDLDNMMTGLEIAEVDDVPDEHAGEYPDENDIVHEVTQETAQETHEENTQADQEIYDMDPLVTQDALTVLEDMGHSDDSADNDTPAHDTPPILADNHSDILDTEIDAVNITPLTPEEENLTINISGPDTQVDDLEEDGSLSHNPDALEEVPTENILDDASAEDEVDDAQIVEDEPLDIEPGPIADIQTFTLSEECIDTCNINIGPGEFFLLIETGPESSFSLESVIYTQLLMNHAPEQSKDIPDIYIQPRGSASIILSGYFADADNDTLLYDTNTFMTSTPSSFAVVSEDDMMTFNSLSDDEQIIEVFIYATDGSEIVQSNTFFIHISNSPAENNTGINITLPIDVPTDMPINISVNDTLQDNVSSNITYTEDINITQPEIINISLENASFNISEIPFTIDSKLLEEYSKDSTAKPRVIIRYREKNKDVNEYLRTLKDDIQSEKQQRGQDFDIDRLERERQRIRSHDPKGDNLITANAIAEPQYIEEAISVIDAKIDAAMLAEKILSQEEFDIKQDTQRADALELGIIELEILKDNPDIEAVYLDSPVEMLLTDAMNITGIDAARTYYHDTTGVLLDGSGVKACIIDSGVDPSIVENFAYGYDFVNADSDPLDDNGHGTLVGYAFYTISPETELVVAKVIDAQGIGYESDVLAGLEYCAAQDAKIISLSIGAGSYPGHCSDNIVAQKVDELSSQGILTIAASGNDGPGIVKAPACARSALAIGASTKSGELAAFSGYNDATLLLAPGANIMTRDISGDYVSASGTSMSAPIVAGAISLYIQSIQSNIHSNDSFTEQGIDEKMMSIVHTGDIIDHEGRQFAQLNLYNLFIWNITNNLTSLPLAGTGGEEGNYTTSVVCSSFSSSSSNCTTNGGDCCYWTGATCASRASGYECGDGLCNKCDGSGTCVAMSLEKDTTGVQTCSALCRTCWAGGCSWVNNNEDTHNECADGTCTTGMCNGAGACAYTTAGTDDGCGGQYDCTSGVIRRRNMCNGAGACAYQDAYATDCAGDCNSYCSGGTCQDTAPGADPYNICTDSGWNGCSGACTKTKTNSGVCSTGTTCFSDSSFLAAGMVCSGGSEVSPSAGTNCDTTINCASGSCSASTYYRGCTAGASSCTDTGRVAGSAWFAGSNSVIIETAYKTGSSCSTNSVAYCGYSSYNKCSGQTPGRDQFRCGGGGNCNYDVGDAYDGAACSGNCNSYCSAGTCQDTAEGADPYNICTDSGYDGCSGTCTKTKSNSGLCGAGTTCGTASSYMTVAGKVCLAGAEVDPDYDNSCDFMVNCVTNACAATVYNRGCAAGSSSCTDTNRLADHTWDPNANYVISETNYKSGETCTQTAVSTSNYCGTATSCSAGACTGTTYYRGCTGSGSCKSDNTGAASSNNILAQAGYTLTAGCGTTGTSPCDSTDHCSGSTWYDGYWCNGAGTCNVDGGSQERDNSQTYCTSGTGCSGTWYSSSFTSGSNYYCCGDDGGSDSFSVYDSSLTTSTSASCSRCSSGSALGTSSYYGNGYTSSDKTTATSLTCYYGDITCVYNSGAHGTSSTYYGNGYLSGSGTSRTCYYGDITCSDGSAGNGASATAYGWGFYSGNLASSTTVDCKSGAASCYNGGYSDDPSSTLYGNGYATASTTTATSLTCYYGNIGCNDGSESNGASSTYYGNGYYTGNLASSTSSTCYYGDMTCSDGSGSNGLSSTIYGNGYYTGNLASSTSTTCYYGDLTCGDGSVSDGASSTIYGNGYSSGTTCYYGDMTCSDGSSSSGTSCALACSGVGSACCPSQGTYRDSVTCTDVTGCAYSDYDRDTTQARCEYSSGGCSAYTWSIGGETAATACCGDDGSENVRTAAYHASMDGASDGTDACCIASTDCVAGGSCYDTGTATQDPDSDSDDDYCNAGTWYDCNADDECSAGYYCRTGDCIIIPNVTINSPAASSWHKEDFSLNYTVTGDVLSLCKLYTRDGTAGSWDDRGDITCGSSQLITITVGASAYCTAEGLDECGVRVWANDTGNVNDSAEQNFSIDYSAPSTAAAAVKADNSQYTFGTRTSSSYINVTLSCDDGIGVGCSQVSYCTDTSDSCAPSTPYTDPVQLSGEGIFYIRYYSNDSLDNMESVQSSTVIFNILPGVDAAVLSSTSGNNYDTDNLTVSFSSSDADLDAIYNTTDWRRNSTSIAVLNMPFNLNVSSISAGAIVDISTFSRNGTLGNGNSNYTPTYVNGKIGGAYYFDGNDYIQTSTISTTDGVTVSAWINPANITYRTIFSLGPQSASAGFHWTYINSGNIYWQYVNGTAYKALSVSYSPSLNNWTMITITHDYASKTVKYYANGALVNTRTHTDPVMNVSNKYVRIGAYAYNDGAFNGSIDEALVFNRALSAEQISAIYTAQNAERSVDKLVSNETVKGDVWSVLVAASDGTSYSSTLSNSLTIVNSPPTIYSARISPSSASVSDTLIGYCNATDADLDNIAYYYAWYLDGVLNATGNTSQVSQALEINVANISQSSLAAGQNWTLSCMANDGLLNSSWLNSSTLMISLSCQNLSIANTAYTLTANISMAGATCFNVQAANVTLDCRGFSITGDNTSSTYGVYTNQYNTTVKNCIISNFTSAIYLQGSTSSTISNVTARNLAGTGAIGTIHINSGSGNTVLNTNTIGGSYYGLRVQATSGNNIINSTFNTSSFYGISLLSSTNNIFYNSTGISSSSSPGIILESNSHANSFIGSIGISSTGTGMYIMSGSNITIDCQARSMIGANTTASYGIHTTQYNTTVRNCTISNFGSGIYFNGTDNGTIEYVTLSTSNDLGQGVHLDSNSNFNTLRNITSNALYGSANAIYITSSHNNSLSQISGSAVSGAGIRLSDGLYNNMTSISGYSTASRGIFISSNSNFNHITNSVGRGISQAGVLILSSHNNTLEYVNGSANTSAGIYLSTGSDNILNYCIGTANTYTGIRIETNSLYNKLSGVYGSSNSTHGIYLTSNSRYNNITSSTGIAYSASNAYSGIMIEADNNYLSSSIAIANTTSALGAPISVVANNSLIYNNTFISPQANTRLLRVIGNNNLFYWNNFTQTTALYINDSSGTNYYNTSIAGLPAGNIYANVLSGSVAIGGSVLSPFAGLYYGSNGFGYPYNNATSQGKISAGVIDYGPLTPFNRTSLCAALNDSNRIYLMTQNAQVSNQTCFTVTAQNVTLDCSGYSITGDNTSSTYGVYTNQFNTTIRNCIITNFSYAIYLDNADNGTVENCVLNSTRTSGSGLYVYNNANYNRLTNISAYSAAGRAIYIGASTYNILNNSIGISGPEKGIMLSYSDYNILSNVIANSTGDAGLNVHTSSRNTFVNVSGLSSSWVGIYISADAGTNSSNNIMTGSRGVSNSDSGIYLLRAIYNIIANSSSTSNAGIGLYITTSTDNNLTSLSINSSSNNAVTVTSNSHRNLLSALTLNPGSTSSDHGIYIDGGVNNTIDCLGSPIIGRNQSGSYGVYSTQVNTTVKNCVVSNFSEAIHYSGATDGLIFNNALSTSFNGGRSINLQASAHRNVLLQNTVLNGNSSGVYVEGGQNITIDCLGRNITGANYSGTYGIYSTQYNTTIRNCNISSFQYGIFYYSAIDGTIFNVTTSSTYSTGSGIRLGLGSLHNMISNSIISSSSYIALILAGANGTIVADNTIHGMGAISSPLYFDTSSNSITYNNTIISTQGIQTLLILNLPSGNNTFYWNNFTATSGMYINDLNGTNHYNTTLDGLPSGNIWPNVIDGSVRIVGNRSSVFPGLNYGSLGTGYPYSNLTSKGKFLCDFSGCADHAPLTPYVNSAPVIASVRITPNPASISDTLTGYCNATDADMDNVTYYYRWYRNSTLNTTGSIGAFMPSSEINIANITNSSLAKDDSWILECIASDGILNSTALNSSPVNIDACYLPLSGRWNITGREVCRNRVLNVPEFVYIEANDTLELYNVTLNSAYTGSTSGTVVRAYSGGNLTSFNSTFTSSSNTYIPYVRVYTGGYAYFNNVTMMTAGPGYMRLYQEAGSRTDIINSRLNYRSEFFGDSKATITDSYINNPYIYVQAGHTVNLDGFSTDDTALDYNLSSSAGMNINITNSDMNNIYLINNGGLLNINNSILYVLGHYTYDGANTTVENTKTAHFYYYHYQANRHILFQDINPPLTGFNVTFTTGYNTIGFTKSNITYVSAYGAGSNANSTVINSTFYVYQGDSGTTNMFINSTLLYYLQMLGSSKTTITNSILDSSSFSRIYGTAIVNFTQPASRVDQLGLIAGAYNPTVHGYVNFTSPINTWGAGNTFNRYFPFNVSYINGVPAQGRIVSIKDGAVTINTGTVGSDGIALINISADNNANPYKNYSIYVDGIFKANISMLTSSAPSGIMLSATASPVISSARISPSPLAYTNASLKGYCNATDIDSANLTYYYAWYLNGAVNATGVTSQNYTQALEINVANISQSALAVGQNWTLGCMATDGLQNSSWMNSSVVYIDVLVPGTVVLIEPTDNNNTVHDRRPLFRWNPATDATWYEINITSNTACTSPIYTNISAPLTNYTPASDLCVKTDDVGNNYYYWNVRGCNGQACGAWSAQWNFSIEPWIVITLTNNAVDFGSITIGEVKDTTSLNPTPFILRNDGNVKADLVNVSASQSLWTRPGSGLGTRYFQMRTGNSTEPGSFNYSASVTDWVNVSSSQENMISQFGYIDTTDSAYLHLKIEVPSDEPSGSKQSSILFAWEQTP